MRAPAAGSASANSYAAAGVSGVSASAAYDDARIVATNTGVVVFWRDASGEGPHLDAMQFNGSTWSTLGGSLAIAGTYGVGESYSIASPGAAVGLAFSVTTANGAALIVMQYSGGAWTALPTPNAAAAANPDASYSLTPTIAYQNATLFLAFVQKDVNTSYDSALYAESYSAGAWHAAGSASGMGLTAINGTVATPTLASNGATLSLAWTSTLQTSGGEINALRVAAWNGTTFAAAQPTDVTGTGIGEIAGAAVVALLRPRRFGARLCRLPGERRRRHFCARGLARCDAGFCRQRPDQHRLAAGERECPCGRADPCGGADLRQRARAGRLRFRRHHSRPRRRGVRVEHLDQWRDRRHPAQPNCFRRDHGRQHRQCDARRGHDAERNPGTARPAC